MKVFNDVAPCRVPCPHCGVYSTLSDSNRKIWRMVNRGRDVLFLYAECRHNFELSGTFVVDRNGKRVEKMSKQRIGAGKYYVLKAYHYLLNVRDSAVDFAIDVYCSENCLVVVALIVSLVILRLSVVMRHQFLGWSE